MTMKMIHKEPPRRRLEDPNEYMSLYGTDGSYHAFWQSGGNSADCEMNFFKDYSGQMRWTYNCWSYNVPELVVQGGTTKIIHPLYCWGQGADFVNFTCRLYVSSAQNRQDDPWFEMDIDCNTKDDGCTCSAARIQGVACDLCETCTKFSTSEIATWTMTPWMVPNVQLVCPADNIYSASQACPTRIGPARRDLGWFTGGLLLGVIGAGTACWLRQRKTHTALSAEPSIHGKEESNYNIHDGGVVA